MELVVLGAVVVAVFAVLVWRRRVVAGDGTATKALPRDLPRTTENLHVRDVVMHFERDYLVEGVVAYEDAGESWRGYRLGDGADASWLCATASGERVVSMQREVDDLPITQRPAESLTYEGSRYELQRWGRAQVRTQGEPGVRGGGACTYFHFAAPGAKVLEIEEWIEGTFRVFAGRTIRAAELELLPGEDQAQEWS